LVDFTFNPGCMDFLAGLAVAAHGHFHLSEAGLSGQGQEENTQCGKRSDISAIDHATGQ
jgi:hypothetical protein